MQIIDQTLNYLISYRTQAKQYFFQNLRKIIRESSKMFIEHTHLQQLLYLEPTIYQLTW